MGGEWRLFSCAYRDQPVCGTAASVKTIRMIGTIFLAAFELNYCVENTPVLLVETEQFLNLKLLPHLHLEDYYSQVLEKGRKLSKSDQEQLLKFIQGLPAQLAFFVRAGNPLTLHQR